jgi:predicted pyridoxine 5'-phosphate oxidase superfamily flavin-nucleotide-binding protein
VAVLDEEMKRLVRRQRLGFVATVAPDGTPNLSPKGSTTVWGEDQIVFADVLSPRTIRNLVDNPRVEINVVDPFTRKGFRFKGKGTVLRSGAEYWKIIEMYKADGTDVRRIRAIVVVRVEFAAPLISPAYEVGVGEADMARSWEEYYRRCRAGEADPGRPILDV